jgi:hypothetical protein
LVVATLVAAFTTVAALQWQQYSLLNGSLRYEGGNVVWVFFQLEVEYLKLRDTLRAIDRDPALLDRDALQTRYDIFVSRVALVDTKLTTVALPITPIQTETVARVRDLVAAADDVLGPDAVRAVDLDSVRWILARVEPLGERVHDMSQWTNDSVELQVGARSDLVRRHNRISIALMIGQLLLTIVFTAIVVRQFRALERRGGALERLAQRLQEARSDAEAASRSKSAFLANMSHELRTPFQGVLGMLALIEDGPLNAQQADQVGTARDSALHLLALVNDVLDVSTLEHGTLKLVPAPTALHRLLDDIEALMGAPARAKGLTLRFRRGADVPAFVLADGTRLKQILFNLLGNAIKFTDAGEVVLEADIEPGSPGQPGLRFKVLDTGIGMDAAALGRLFQRFSQGDESTSRRFGGTGLGLEISLNLAAMMGGGILVTSEPGRGSCFTLRLPLPRCDSPAADPVARAVLETRALRVLVAEDHPINRKYVQTLLARLGHDVTLRENGLLAAETAAGQDFDLVLMDMHMPVMDGLAATRAIRALPHPRGAVRILALTADAYPQTREKAAQAGMDDFLAKPVQPAELQAALFRLFGGPIAEVAMSSGQDPNPPEASPAGASASLSSGLSPFPMTLTSPSPSPSPLPSPSPSPSPWPSSLRLDPSTPEASFGDLGPDFHASLLHDFFGDESGSIARLLTCLQGSAGTGMREAAHAVKGGALSLGLLRLAETTRAIEALGDDTEAGQIGAWRQGLLAELAQTRIACIDAGWMTELAPSVELA